MRQSLIKARQIAARHRKARAVPGVCAKSGDTGELYIYEMIGEDWWTGGGVTAKKIVEALDALKGVSTVNVYINSEGGDVFEAKAIFENLKRFAAEKVVHVDGIAASAATFIAMAGDRIITAPAATWMVHEAWAMAVGRAGDMRAMADVLDLENRAIAETYAARTKRSAEEMVELMAAETWMSAQEAKDLGFTDEIAREEAASQVDDEKMAARSTPAISLAAQTEARVGLARQARRLQQLSGRSVRPPALAQRTNLNPRSTT